MAEHEPAAHMPPPPPTLSAEATAQMALMGANGPLPTMSMEQIRFFTDGVQTMVDAKLAYVGKADPSDPMLSPIFGDLSFFPPTLCLSSGRDVLLSGTVNLNRKLSDAGVHSELVVYDALPHAFWSSMLAPKSDDAFRRMSAFLVKHLGRR